MDLPLGLFLRIILLAREINGKMKLYLNLVAKVPLLARLLIMHGHLPLDDDILVFTWSKTSRHQLLRLCFGSLLAHGIRVDLGANLLKKALLLLLAAVLLEVWFANIIADSLIVWFEHAFVHLLLISNLRFVAIERRFPSLLFDRVTLLDDTRVLRRLHVATIVESFHDWCRSLGKARGNTLIITAAYAFTSI